MMTNEESQPTLTRQQKHLIDTSSQIMLDPHPRQSEITFLSRQLISTTLPHSNPGNVPAWSRTNGNLTLTVRPGWDARNQRSFGYPHGTVPRLLLYWLGREATRTKSRTLHLGNSLADFMRQLGLDPARGGKRSDATRLRAQMQKLFRATISFDLYAEGENSVNEAWLDMQVASQGDIWWSTSDPNQPAIWGSTVTLGEHFYEALVTRPVPLDMRALCALKSSSMALDLYAWTAWRSFRLLQKGEPAMIPWRSIAQQVGSSYQDPKHFKRKAKQALVKISLVNPSLKIEQVHGGIKLFPSYSPVLSKQ